MNIFRKKSFPKLQDLVNSVVAAVDPNVTPQDVSEDVTDAGVRDAKNRIDTDVFRDMIKNAVEAAVLRLASEYEKRRQELGVQSSQLANEKQRLAQLTSEAPQLQDVEHSATGPVPGGDEMTPQQRALFERQERARAQSQADQVQQMNQAAVNEYQEGKKQVSSVNSAYDAALAERADLLSVYRKKADECRERGELLLSYYADGYADGERSRGDDGGAVRLTEPPIEFEYPEIFLDGYVDDQDETPSPAADDPDPAVTDPVTNKADTTNGDDGGTV